ncbi:MAG: sterol desaturase family protein [Myxococcota bacterium]|nr:sterol desaturase family protein [Myxococcota bacterium]
METLERALAALLEPIRGLGAPEERVFWGYLVTSAALGAMVWARKLRGRVPLRRFLLAREVWLHRSALLDYRLLFVRAVVDAVLFAPLVMSSAAVAFGTLALLTRGLGGGPLHDAPAWAAVAALTFSSFVFEDLLRFLAHWLSHRVPVLWEIHQVHHSAEVLTPFTVFRTHPLEALFMRVSGAVGIGIGAGLVLWLFRRGVGAWEIAGVHALSVVWNAVGANLRHSQVWLSYGRVLEHVFVSPAQHQIHHSLDPRHHDRNFGAVFALWDWLFGTLYVTGARERLHYGLPSSERNHDDTVSSVLFGPLVAILRTLRRRVGSIGAAGRRFLHRGAGSRIPPENERSGPAVP